MIELCIFYKQHEHRLIIRDVHTNEYQVVQHKVVVNMLMIYIVSQVVPDQAVLWLCKLRLFQHQTTATFDGPQKTVNLTKQLLVYDSYPFINICSDMFILSFTSRTQIMSNGRDRPIAQMYIVFIVNKDKMAIVLLF